MALTKVGSGVIQDDAVGIANLGATGTASATTFLRGDNAWASAAAGLEALTIFTATGTWTKATNNPTKIIVEVIAAAGGSGAGAGSGGSGGAGSYAKVFLDVGTVTTATATVGAAGAAGSSGAGGAGGLSKFTYLAGTGSFTEINCPGGNGGGHANHVGGSGTAVSTGPTNGVYVAGNGGGGASNAGNCCHGYGASQHGGYTYNYATGYGSANGGTGSATTGRAGMPGLILVWEYK